MKMVVDINCIPILCLDLWEHAYWQEHDGEATGSYLDAFDKATGELLAQVKVETNLHSSPMTYLHDGRQYLVIGGGGERPGPGVNISQTARAGAKETVSRREPRKSELLAFALPP